MMFTRVYGTRWINHHHFISRCYLSTDRPETISSALKRFYLKVHPDLFTQYPSEKDVNEKSLQLVSAYLSSLQRKEYLPSITVTFFTKIPTNTLPPVQIQLSRHRLTLNSKDLLTCVNSILHALNLPTIDVPKEQQKQQEPLFKIVEIEKHYDFTKIPKVSIKTWLTSNVEIARSIAKRHKDLLNEINEKVHGIQERFKLKSIEYNDNWSVAQFSACLRTLMIYIDKWHEKLLTLQGKRLIFGNKSSLLQDGSLELGANDPPVYWDQVICCELPESDVYMEKIAAYEDRLCQYFPGIQIRQDPDSDNTCRAHTYLYQLLQINQNLDINRHHQAHTTKKWNDYFLFVNPFSSEPSVTESGIFQINAYDATMDILDFMIENREKAKLSMKVYEKTVREEQKLLELVKREYHLTDIVANRRMKKSKIVECCQRLLAERQHFLSILSQCRLKIDTSYNLAQDGTLSIPWDWSLVQEETL